MTGGDPGTRKADEHRLRTLDTLPRVGIRELARLPGRFARPGRPRSPRWGMGDRVLIDVPLGPTVVLTSAPEDAKAVFANRSGVLSFGEMLRHRTETLARLFHFDCWGVNVRTAPVTPIGLRQVDPSKSAKSE